MLGATAHSSCFPLCHFSWVPLLLGLLSPLSLHLCLFPSCSKQVGIEEMSGVGDYGGGREEASVGNFPGLDLLRDPQGVSSHS